MICVTHVCMLRESENTRTCEYCTRLTKSDTSGHCLVVAVPRLRGKVLEVLLDLRRVEGALGRKQLQHRHPERRVVLVVLVVAAQLHKVEKQLRAACSDRPAEQRQERLIVVGQRALRHKQRAVAARVLVQHHPLLALGVAAAECVLEAARQHAVSGRAFPSFSSSR